MTPCIEEQLAIRKAVGILDQTSFGKLRVRGRDAAALLDRVCANTIGKLTYTAMLNRKGGFESDVTVQRWADDDFLVVTGSAQPVRDAAWLRRHIQEGEDVHVDDVSAEWSVISVLGPMRRRCCSRRRTSAARAPVPASYVGGPGTEIYVRVEDAPALYDRLCAAGKEFGLKDCGYYALDALRIEAGRRAFGPELSPDCTPYEAGLGFRRAPRAAQAAGQAGEAPADVHVPGDRAVRVGRRADPAQRQAGGRALFGRLQRDARAAWSAWASSIREDIDGAYEIEVSGQKVPAKASLKAPWPVRR